VTKGRKAVRKLYLKQKKKLWKKTDYWENSTKGGTAIQEGGGGGSHGKGFICWTGGMWELVQCKVLSLTNEDAETSTVAAETIARREKNDLAGCKSRGKK